MAVNTHHELFSYFYDKIISREISTFSDLAERIDRVKTSFNKSPVVYRCFQLLKELHWGYFSHITKSTHPKLWRELILTHSKYTSAGDLKRNITISNLYIALLDIHGYTRFCQNSKKNISKLHKLDEFIAQGIQKIATDNGAVSQRERGDEILVIASSATDILRTVMGIIDTFADKPIFDDDTVTHNHEDYGITLPEFQVSAGIAGGNLSTPLIITEQGMLSGFLLNTAARLQGRSNELSPSLTRVTCTNTVRQKFEKENTHKKSPLYDSGRLFFLDCGVLEFKGINISTCEIIFHPQDEYKKRLAKPIEELFNAIKNGYWQHRIFNSLINLIHFTAQIMNKFEIEITTKTGLDLINPQSIRIMCDRSLQFYAEEDYINAIHTLERIIERIKLVPDFDRLVIDIAENILKVYVNLLEEYEELLDEQVNKNIDNIFNIKYKTAFYNAKRSIETYRKLQQLARKNPVIDMKKNLWYNLINRNKSDMDIVIHSGKK